jgi:hypothetical protein
MLPDSHGDVAIAIPDLVGESLDLFGDGGHAAIVAKVGGNAAVAGRGGVLEPFPGAGGLDWRISRVDVGGLDGSQAVVGARFPGACSIWCAHVQRSVFKTATKCGGGRGGVGFFTAGWASLLVVMKGGGAMLRCPPGGQGHGGMRSKSLA